MLTGLVACDSFRVEPIEGGLVYKDSIVESNGGLVVKQGSYLYFVNGLGEYSTPNKFGQVIKGSIMRCELNDDGSIKDKGDDTYVTIVPKKVLNGYTDGGFYIFGEWIYYVTPTEAKNSSGQVQSQQYSEFMRTKTDGTGTEVIKRIAGSSTQYVFMDNTLLLYMNSEIISINCTTKKETTISTDVSSVIFPRVTFNPEAASADPDNFFYYTKTNPEDETYGSYNQLCASNADGSRNFIMTDKFTYLPGFDPAGEALPDFNLIYTFKILRYENGRIFYTKTGNNGSVEAGIWSLELNGAFVGEFEFDGKKEEQLSNLNIYSSILPYEDGILAVESSNIYYVKNGGADRELIISSLSLTMLEVREGYLYFRESDGKICRFSIAKDKLKETILETAPNMTWLYPEMLGDFIYYIGTPYNYTVQMKIGGGITAIGKWTTEDFEASASASAASSATPTPTSR